MIQYTWDNQSKDCYLNWFYLRWGDTGKTSHTSLRYTEPSLHCHTMVYLQLVNWQKGITCLRLVMSMRQIIKEKCLFWEPQKPMESNHTPKRLKLKKLKTQIWAISALLDWYQTTSGSVVVMQTCRNSFSFSKINHHWNQAWSEMCWKTL